MKKITAIVVARKGSKRIKSKSLLRLNGETLIERKIRQLLACRNITNVVFGSDSEEMLEAGLKAGAEVVRRPDFYCDEEVATANDMIENMLSLVQTDVVVWAHCTNPLISSETYDAAVDTYFAKLKEGYDSLLSVVALREHLWREDKKATLNYNPYAARHVPARELPPYFMQDGGIFIQPYEQMKKNRYFFGQKPYLFEVSANEFLDINEKRDYLLAQAILKEERNKYDNE